MNEIYDYLKNGGTTLRVVPRLSIKEQVLTFPSFDISLPIVSNGGGYGALYNWFCTQNQLKSITNGYLYNWYAATDSRNIAPVGFHVPTLAEWGILKTYVGGYLVAGQKLKESNPLYWVLNTGTNVFNFNTRGSASRNVVGFGNLNSEFFAWTTDPQTGTTSWRVEIYDDSNVSPSGEFENFNGYSLRFIADSGTPTTATGNDGKVYPCVTIGGQTWTAVNSMEIKYQNGDTIPEVTDNTEWSGLTTGARCSYNNDEANAGTFTKLSSSDEWVVPTVTIMRNMLRYIDPNWSIDPILNTSGGHMKEVGLTHWDTPNANADNSSGFNGVGSGQRGYFDGVFSALKLFCNLWNTYDVSSIYGGCGTLNYNSGIFNMDYNVMLQKQSGATIRLCNPSTLNADGYVGTYTQNDGTIIPTIVINGVECTMNLEETKWRDGSWIKGFDGGVYTPISNEDWCLLETAAMCYYNNNLANPEIPLYRLLVTDTPPMEGLWEPIVIIDAVYPEGEVVQLPGYDHGEVGYTFSSWSNEDGSIYGVYLDTIGDVSTVDAVRSKTTFITMPNHNVTILMNQSS